MGNCGSRLAVEEREPVELSSTSTSTLVAEERPARLKLPRASLPTSTITSEEEEDCNEFDSEWDIRRYQEYMIRENEIMVVVGVGGNRVRFYYDEVDLEELLFKITYFAAAIRSGMREVRERKFEFPDMHRNTWANILNLAEMSHDKTAEIMSDPLKGFWMLQDQLTMITGYDWYAVTVDWNELIHFCDYFGLDDWKNNLDLLITAIKYEEFELCLASPECPLLLDYKALDVPSYLFKAAQKVQDYFVTRSFEHEVYLLSLDMYDESEFQIVDYLLDNYYGEHLWKRLFAIIKLSKELQDWERETIVNGDDFLDLLKRYSAGMTNPLSAPEDPSLPLELEEMLGKNKPRMHHSRVFHIYLSKILESIETDEDDLDDYVEYLMTDDDGKSCSEETPLKIVRDIASVKSETNHRISLVRDEEMNMKRPKAEAIKSTGYYAIQMIKDAEAYTREMYVLRCGSCCGLAS